MPTIPPNKTHTTDTSKHSSVTFNVPRVHHLSSSILQSNGWMIFDKGKWVKNKHTISFDGVKFVLDGEKVISFFEDLPKQ